MSIKVASATARLRMLEIDGINADADLLDQPQLRGRVHHLRRHGLEHMQQRLGVAQ